MNLLFNFLAVPGVVAAEGLSPVAASRAAPLCAEHSLGLLTAAASPVALGHVGFSTCSTACAIPLARGRSLWDLHWQAVFPTELPEKFHSAFLG